jgi:hypothetical protein
MIIVQQGLSRGRGSGPHGHKGREVMGLWLKNIDGSLLQACFGNLLSRLQEGQGSGRYGV